MLNSLSCVDAFPLPYVHLEFIFVSNTHHRQSSLSASSSSRNLLAIFLTTKGADVTSPTSIAKTVVPKAEGVEVVMYGMEPNNEIKFDEWVLFGF